VNDLLLQETYDANVGLSAEQKQFTLSPNINQDEDDSQEQKEDDMQLFLQYDREQLILARIACFDSDAHRYQEICVESAYMCNLFEIFFVLQACKYGNAETTTCKKWQIA
jgi:hypothetical protein